MNRYIVYFLLILITVSCGDSKRNSLVKKYECDSIDDCLSKYEFEGARAYLAVENESHILDDYFQQMKIVEAECNYWLKEKEYKKAISVIDESPSSLYGNEKMSLRFRVLGLIIDELIEDGDFQKAKLYALKASDEHTIEGRKESDTDDFDKEKTQQKLLLKKIETAEKLLSK